MTTEPKSNRDGGSYPYGQRILNDSDADKPLRPTLEESPPPRRPGGENPTNSREGTVVKSPWSST